MNPYTVIGTYSDTGEIFATHYMAPHGMAALALTALDREDDNIELVVCIEGRLKEDEALTFPGTGVVDGETFLTNHPLAS